MHSHVHMCLANMQSVTVAVSYMQVIPGHLGQHCPCGGGSGLVQGGRAHSTSLQSIGCGMKTCVWWDIWGSKINDYG